MRSLFYDIHRTVMNAVGRAGYHLVRVLSILGIPRSWYYAHMEFSLLLDGRFNPFAARDGEWIVIGYKHIAYLSPSTIYSILNKNRLTVEWKRRKDWMNGGRQTSCKS